MDFYLSWPTLSLYAGKAFPGDIFLCLRHRLVKLRNSGDTLSSEDFDKFILNKVKYVFIRESDKAAFVEWTAQCATQDRENSFQGSTPEQQEIIETTVELRRAALDLFENPRGDETAKAALTMSKKLVTDFLKRPYVINNINQLSRYGKGCVDHSVNVAVLSVFLGLRMGYSSQVILEHLSMGGLLHDIGKTNVSDQSEGPFDAGGDNKGDNEDVMQHPIQGKEFLEASREVSNEVRMIVAQHHEYLDGTGYPLKLRGLAIYDLARVVAIANTYDNLVSQNPSEDLKVRAAQALVALEKNYEGKLDSRKLEKAIKVIRTSLA